MCLPWRCKIKKYLLKLLSVNLKIFLCINAMLSFLRGTYEGSLLWRKSRAEMEIKANFFPISQSWISLCALCILTVVQTRWFSFCMAFPVDLCHGKVNQRKWEWHRLLLDWCEGLSQVYLWKCILYKFYVRYLVGVVESVEAVVYQPSENFR